ncbi:hypothetical protein WJX79_001396 [Trebouxia sp. C0005]
MVHTCSSNRLWSVHPFRVRIPEVTSKLRSKSSQSDHASYNEQSYVLRNQKDSCSLTDTPVRRQMLLSLLGSSALIALPAVAEPKFEQMEALKGKDYGKVRTKYPDYVLTDSGLQYKDLRDGSGDAVSNGSHVTVDWDGYTLGYYGRPFEARNKSKGGAFVGDSKDFLKFTVGDHSVIPAFEEAMVGMRVGGVRRLIVPQELGYPGQPPDFTKQGPTPGNFSGRRALDFVLKNQGLIDKTLLFDIELMRVN